MLTSIKHALVSLSAIVLLLVLGGCVAYPAGYYAQPGYYGQPATVVAPYAPPPVVVESYGPPPIVGDIWISGYWSWSGGRHVWTPGRWEHPRPGYRWVPRTWAQGQGGWHQHGGHWERH